MLRQACGLLMVAKIQMFAINIEPIGFGQKLVQLAPQTLLKLLGLYTAKACHAPTLPEQQ